MHELHVVKQSSVVHVCVRHDLVFMSDELHVAVDSAEEVEDCQDDEIRGDAVKKTEHLSNINSELGDLEGQADVTKVVSAVACTSQRINPITLASR